MPDPLFEKSVFINCPFDKDYEPILQAMLFCIVYLGFQPRLATELTDSAEDRLSKICTLIETSKYSIHDLSRCQATKNRQISRLNMPFELGIDYGCRKYFGSGRTEKRILILEEKQFRYRTAISDLSGCDIQAHDGKFEQALRKVRNWLGMETDKPAKGASFILGKYADFQEWHYETQLAAGHNEEDIKDYPTKELLDAMRKWVREGEPLD